MTPEKPASITVRAPVAAAIVASTLFACAAAIELMRATASHSAEVVGLFVFLIFVAASYSVALRLRLLANVSVVSAFALAAHGGVLVLEGQIVGMLFLGIAPLASLLAHVAFATPGDTIADQWSPRTASAARPAASLNPHAMRA